MNYFKNLLSKSTKQWVTFLIASFFFLSVIFALPLFSIPSIIAMLIYSNVVAWFLAGTVRKFIFNLFFSGGRGGEGLCLPVLPLSSVCDLGQVIDFFVLETSSATCISQCLPHMGVGRSQ